MIEGFVIFKRSES